LLLLHYVTETKIKVSQWFYHSEDAAVDSSGRIWAKPNDVSDVDWFIVRLNNQGMSLSKISKALKTRTPPVSLTPHAVRNHLIRMEKRFKGITKANYPAPAFYWYPGTVNKPAASDIMKGIKDLIGTLTSQDLEGKRSVPHPGTATGEGEGAPMSPPPIPPAAGTFHGLTELDRAILMLNNRGMTTGQIEKALPSYGMKLSKTRIWNHLLEIRHINPDMYVKVNSKLVGGKPREEGKWYNIILKVKDAINEYVGLKGFKPSVRTMQYDFIDYKIIKETETKQFQTEVTRARLGYRGSDGKLLLPKLDIDCFAADDTRELAGNYEDFEPTETVQPGEIPDSNKIIDELIAKVRNAPVEYDGKQPEGTKGKRGGRWFGQPEYVEVWVEKNDLLEAFEKILEGRHVNIRGNHGFASFDWLRQCAEALKDVIETKGMKPENVHIIYCGDMDPSGEIMDNYMGRRLKLEEFGLPHGIDFERIAILPGQIDQHHFPLLNIEKKPDKKKEHSNLCEYVRRFGWKATHLNAFFTRTHFEEFRKLLLAKVDSLWYQEIYDVMVEVYEVEPKEPESLPEEELKQRRIEMYRKITKAFASGWYRGLPWAPDYW
jgi:hypothetical protein